MFVTHGTDLHALVPLSVSLGEELDHDAVRPLPVKLQWFRWVAQVSTMDHVLQNLGRHAQSDTLHAVFLFQMCPVFKSQQ